MDIPLPDFEPRLQRRYQQLVQEHLHTSEGQAAGGRALPSVHEAFASTQAAWRYYANEAVTLPGLAAPLLAQARQMLPTTCRRYGLVAHDWSALRYPTHDSKLDRRLLGKDLGYELATALLLSDARANRRMKILAVLKRRAADILHPFRTPQKSSV